MKISTSCGNSFNVIVNTNGKGLITGFELDGFLASTEYIINFVIPTQVNNEKIVAIGCNVFGGYLRTVRIFNLSIPEGITRLSQNSFADTKIEMVSIPKTLKTIESGSFARTNVTTVYGSENIIKLNRFAFRDCKYLSSISLENCEEISSKAFAGCTQLNMCYIPKVKRLGEGVFRSCRRLTKITIPISCTHISPNCFFKCDSLKEFIIEAIDVYIGKTAFYGTSLKSIDLPNALSFYKDSPMINKYGDSIKVKFSGIYNSIVT